MSEFQVAVAIPAHNEELRIEHTLASVNEAVKSFGLPVTRIVVNSASTDRTPEISSDLGFQVIQSELGISNARNAALEYAVGQGCTHLITSDADCIVKPGWVGTHIQRLTKSDHPSMTIGRVKFHYESDLKPLTIAELQAYDSVKTLMIFLRKKRNVYHPTSANMGLNINDTVDVGGYPNLTGCNEDGELMKIFIDNGKLIAPVDALVTTSTRRILGEGLMRLGIARFLNIFGYKNKTQKGLEKEYRIFR